MKPNTRVRELASATPLPLEPGGGDDDGWAAAEAATSEQRDKQTWGRRKRLQLGARHSRDGTRSTTTDRATDGRTLAERKWRGSTR